MLKVGIIGAGGMGGVHIDVWKKMEDVEVVAICDVTPAALEKHVEGNIKGYADYNEMLEKESFDIIDICTPTYLHKAPALAALNKHINVLCEKPICLNKQDAQEVYAAAKANDVKFMVAHVIRFWDEYITLKEIIESKRYGKMLNGEFWRLSALPRWSFENWMVDDNRSGGIPLDLHIHDLDYIVSVFGTPNKIVHDRGRANKGAVISDHLDATYYYDDFYCKCSASWYDNDYPFTSGFRVHFENAVVEYTNDELTAYTPGKIEKLGQRLEGDGVGINLPATNGYENEIRYFTDCVKQNTTPTVVVEDEVYAVLDIVAPKA